MTSPYTSYGTPLTTLLKKDGTGKIGVFRINGNSASVHDDSNGEEKVSISSNNINSCLGTIGDVISLTQTVNDGSGFEGWEGYDGRLGVVFEQNLTLSIGRYNLNISAANLTFEAESASVGSTITIPAWLQFITTSSKPSVIMTKTFELRTVKDEDGICRLSFYKVFEDIEIERTCKIRLLFIGDPQAIQPIATSYKFKCNMWQVKSSKTIIANDGIMVYNGDYCNVIIKKSGPLQDVIFKGLPGQVACVDYNSLNTGQLYVDDMNSNYTVNALYDTLVDLNNALLSLYSWIGNQTNSSVTNNAKNHISKSRKSIEKLSNIIQNNTKLLCIK